MARAIQTIKILVFVLSLIIFPAFVSADVLTGTQLAGESAGSLDQAVKKIRAKTKGKIMSQKQVNSGGRTYFHIKVLLPNGKVKVYKVNKR